MNGTREPCERGSVIGIPIPSHILTLCHSVWRKEPYHPIGCSLRCTAFLACGCLHATSFLNRVESAAVTHGGREVPLRNRIATNRRSRKWDRWVRLY